MKSKRMLNFELLRIVCMFGIIFHHYVLKGGILELEEISINKFIASIIYIGGKLGVIIFIFISGYFLVDSKFKFRNLIKIFLQTLFYSVVIYSVLVLTGMVKISFKDCIKSLLPISYDQYWFVTGYIGMYLFMPFLNILIKNVTERQYEILLLFGGILFIFLPTFIVGGGEAFLNSTTYFMYLYLLIAYVKKYDIKFLNNKKKCIIAITITLLIMIIVSALSMLLSTRVKVLERGITYLANQNSLTMVILALAIFQLFKKIEIKDNNIIRIMANSSFSVYLIHENPYFSKILWNDIVKTQNYYYSTVGIFISSICISAICIYLISIISELFRKNIFEKWLINYYEKYISDKLSVVEATIVGVEKKNEKNINIWYE